MRTCGKRSPSLAERPFWDVTINIAVGGDDSGIEPSGEMAFDTINGIVGRISAANYSDGVKPTDTENCTSSI